MTQKQNIVFLDYDGVISDCTSRLVNPIPEEILNDEIMLGLFSNAGVNSNSLFCLQELQEKTDCQFVIVSRWVDSATKEQWQQWFRSNGFEIRLHEDWKCLASLTELHVLLQQYKEQIETNALLYIQNIPQKVLFDMITGITLEADKVHHERLLSSSLCSNDTVRGWGIVDWLYRHGATNLNHPENFNYIVIDDEIKSSPTPISYLIHVKDGERTGGFNFNHLQEALEVLKAQDNCK